MNSTWPRRSIEPFGPGALSFAKNHTHTGIPVLRNSCVGSATMHDTWSASTSRALISPSPPEFEDMVPLAITTPALPRSASFDRMC